MDPTTLLKEILETCKEIEKYELTPGFITHKDILEELSAKILDLNYWINHGGFLPSQWDKE